MISELPIEEDAHGGYCTLICYAISDNGYCKKFCKKSA